jgi:hypothetical protein
LYIRILQSRREDAPRKMLLISNGVFPKTVLDILLINFGFLTGHKVFEELREG